MKRKSIFLTIVAVFLTAVSWGQTQPSWPSSYPVGGNVVGSDTIYFCITPDSLYPIELGYDVAGLDLRPSYGDWALYTTTSTNVVASDYVFGSAKNDGAGNAYKTQGSGIGGYIFEYTSKVDLCGLATGKKFWAYVFVLPDFSAKPQKADSIICKKDGATFDVKFDEYFASTLEVYQEAGIAYHWKGSLSGNFTNNDQSTPDTHSFVDTLVLDSPIPDGYTCGLEGEFKVTVKVLDSIYLESIAIEICAEDTVGKENVNPNHYFKRNVAGSYVPEYVIDGTAWGTAPNGKKYREYVFSYNDCKHVALATVSDTIYLLDGPKGNWGVDSVSYCRTPGPEDIYTFWNEVTGSKLPLELGSHWYDRGLVGQGWTSSDGYGTTDDKPSLDGEALRLDSMVSSVGYHYLWQVDLGVTAFECLVNGNGEGDSGYLVVILRDRVSAQDYTAQLCGASYASLSYKFDLAKYTGLDVDWWIGGKPDATGATKVGKEWTIPTYGGVAKPNTYKLYYDLASDCGSGAGVFYIKVNEKVRVSGSKEVLYCLRKLPAQINLNDVLNVAVGDLEWAVTGTVPGFTNDGLLDVGTYMVGKSPNTEQTLVFTTDNGSGCGVPDGTTLTIKFVTDILQ
ncbi:MAG: hypothetical protein LBS43_02210 [Prevotellaceae bacterium]|jgi:hypothetical protein|nr:hypothetical protein [Prevotellaceae bacterium]